MTFLFDTYISIFHRVTIWLEGITEGHLVQPCCSSWATYSQLPRTVSRQFLSISKDGGCVVSGQSGQSVPVLSHSQSKKVFWCSEGTPVFHFVPVDSGPGTGHLWKETGSVPYAPSRQVFVYSDEIPLSFLWSSLLSLDMIFCLYCFVFTFCGKWNIGKFYLRGWENDPQVSADNEN